MEQGIRRALAAIARCRTVAEALLPPMRDPAVGAALGSGDAYRLAVACAWAFGEEAAGTLHLVLLVARGSPAGSHLWRPLVSATTHAMVTCCLVRSLGRQAPSEAGGPQQQ